MSKRKTPIELLTYNLMKTTARVMSGMSKDYKHTIGQRLFELSIDIYMEICTAADVSLSRVSSLESVRGDIFKMSGLFKLCHELHLLGKHKEANDEIYIDICILIEKIEKQQASWYKATVDKSARV